MKVIDQQEQHWFLFEHEGSLLFDCNCNHSFVGYSYMIELNSEETGSYKAEGRSYLSTLSSAIQNSAPILETSNSIYKGRDISEKYSDLSMEAVRAWQQSMLNK